MTQEILYGRRPVYETLRAGRRVIRRLLISEQANRSEIGQHIVQQAEAQQVPVKVTRREELDSRLRGVNHQGVGLEVGPYPYSTLEAILAHTNEQGEPPFLLLLDLLQDVQNVGTLLRTAEAVGIHGVIIQERRGASVTPAVVSASSGAVEYLNVARVTNLVQAMKTLQQNDVWLAGLDVGEDATRHDQADLTGGLGLVVGSEGEGLRRLVRETCDFIIHLPMRGQVESLNAAVAGSVALYAAWQARQFS
jgi:23S rRNA (guanosine2251-2'-O)-methyltransferase